MTHLPAKLPKLHSSQMRTSVVGRTYESHTGHLPSHLSHSLPMVVPGCLRQCTRSGWCRDILVSGVCLGLSWCCVGFEAEKKSCVNRSWKMNAKKVGRKINDVDDDL